MSNEKIITVYVTKYFAASGILTWRVKTFKSSFTAGLFYAQKVDTAGRTTGNAALAIGKDCFEDLQDAVEAAKKIKIKKIASLEKQIKKLAAMSLEAQPLE